MTEVVFVSDTKVYGRLGIPQVAIQRDTGGSINFPPSAPIVQASVSRSRSDASSGRATLDELAQAIKKVEKLHDPAEITDFGLQTNRWVRFDLRLAQRPVFEDSGRPPADVVIFAGDIPAGEAGQPRDMGVLLCGSIQHLRTRNLPPGRMGSDTTWLHELVIEIGRREERGIYAIPEYLTEIVPSRRPEILREDAALGVHGWVSRDNPVEGRPRMRGHAIVLMDIDHPRQSKRLVVASPLYVEVPPQRDSRRRFTLLRRRQIATTEPTPAAQTDPPSSDPAPR